MESQINKNSSRISASKKFLHLLNILRRKEEIEAKVFNFFLTYVKKGGGIVGLQRFLDLGCLVASKNPRWGDKFGKLSQILFPSLFASLPASFLQDPSSLSPILEGIKDTFAETLPFTLSKDQEEAVLLCLRFLVHPHQPCTGIFGYAGTGKTTVTVELMAYLLRGEKGDQNSLLDHP
jgi:hypothetical protein